MRSVPRMKTRNDGSLIPRLTIMSRIDIFVGRGVAGMAKSALKEDTTASKR